MGDKMKSVFFLLILFFSFVSVNNAQSKEDSLAIKQAAIDYLGGWYEGNAARMEKALHPDLAKRIIHTDPKSGRSRLDQMSAMTLVQYTRMREGKVTPENERQMDIYIHDIYKNIASVKAIAKDWVDLLHIGKYNGEWKIVNVLWQMKPKN